MNLNKAKTELVVHHKLIEAFKKQKANLKWQLEGDENTKYFHTVVRGKRSC